MEERSGCWKREEKFPMVVGVGRLTKNCRGYRVLARDSHISGNSHRDQGSFQPLGNSLVITGLTLVTLIMLFCLRFHAATRIK